MITAGVVPMGIASLAITQSASDTMRESTYTLLNEAISARKQFMQSFVHDVIKHNETTARSLLTRNAVRTFKKSFDQLPEDHGLTQTDSARISTDQHGPQSILQWHYQPAIYRLRHEHAQQHFAAAKNAVRLAGTESLHCRK
jgi:hypothetical protein